MGPPHELVIITVKGSHFSSLQGQCTYIPYHVYGEACVAQGLRPVLTQVVMGGVIHIVVQQKLTTL